MTWPPRTILALSVAVLLVLLLIAATAIPWYRRLHISPNGQRIIVPSAIISLLTLIACVAFLVSDLLGVTFEGERWNAGAPA
jgi:formate-dependent nitrite reductase membrane component NrfD